MREREPSLVYAFRQSTPYVNVHRGATFVLMMGGEALCHPNFANIVSDIALLQTLGIMDSLRSQKIELILDVNLPNHKNDKEWQKSLFKIIDSGHMVCLGGYNWKDNEPQDFQMVKELFKYVRLGPPPSNLAEVNHFVDTCFYIKEKLAMQLILDRVQSQTDLDIACRTPFFALMGDYISTAHLAKNLEDVSYKVML